MRKVKALNNNDLGFMIIAAAASMVILSITFKSCLGILVNFIR